MEWWTHLWLNEGFATWIEYLCVDHTHPEFEIWTNFLSREYASALSLDALSSSHPIEVRQSAERGRGRVCGLESMTGVWLEKYGNPVHMYDSCCLFV